jgi:tripartite-type tricarboxylate transporter receptor subunit TctC
LRPLAVTSAARSPTVPDLPTIAEAALPGYEAVTWWGILGPARLPRGIVDKIHADVVRVLAMPDTKAKLANEGVNGSGSSPAQFARMIDTEIVKMAQIVKAANVKLD